jgi:hypothetical protein
MHDQSGIGRELVMKKGRIAEKILLLKSFFRERNWWRDQQKFFRQKQRRIAQGKELHPVMMTQEQRHAATTRAVAKLKWSGTFMEAMTTPLTLQALMNGGRVRDVRTGEEFVLTAEEMKRFEGMTREDFIRLRRKWRLSLDKEGVKPCS